MKRAKLTWTHPELGTLVHDWQWQTTVRASAYDVFRFDTGYQHDRDSFGQYTLTFESENERDVPTAEEVELAMRVLNGAPQLVQTVATALWNDFNGRGPDSGMWWHDDLDVVNEDLEPLQSVDDIYNVLRLFEIRVRKYGGPLVELCFWAAFEPEHNVGVLTNGVEVLGIGYQADVSLFAEIGRNEAEDD